MTIKLKFMFCLEMCVFSLRRLDLRLEYILYTIKLILLQFLNTL